MGTWIAFLPLAGILSIWTRNLGEVIRLVGVLLLFLLLERLPGRASSCPRCRLRGLQRIAQGEFVQGGEVRQSSSKRDEMHLYV
ncbi:hypothetical protein DFJ58DRAFT_758919 [Suillus subalutaceus]|uniref:uncharacterized protein n=1 Tax=Suillus subalutaceus TaxID=48586 RepID=UPI001B87CA8D|nr:uncharacterized protein DFJ58DRAFT_758919 [Suillus subalutaceus]KAG1873538.1 hypothetical protein DFJ58DRAFT_758919 [Suillus subalutaceus]